MRQRVQLDQQKIGVYLLQTPSGKCYVGMTCDSFQRRWRGHAKELRLGVHKTLGLQNAYQKYGWESIQKIVLEEWDKPLTINKLLNIEKIILRRERDWWELFNESGAPMLHGCPTGTGSVIHTTETKLKIGSAQPKILFSESEKSELTAILQKCTSWDEIKVKTGMTRRKLYVRGFLKEEVDLLPFLCDPSEEEIRRLYVEEKKTIREVANAINRTHPVVIRLLRKYQIESR